MLAVGPSDRRATTARSGLAASVVLWPLVIGCASAPPPPVAPPTMAPEPENTWTPQSPQEKWWTEATPCPAGAKLVGSPPPAGNTLACIDERGRHHGRASVWFDSGHSGTLTEYRRDVPNGRYLYWLHNNRLVEGTYVNGRRDGDWTYYFAPGTGFDMTSRWADDAERTVVIEVYDHGLLVNTKSYRDGRPARDGRASEVGSP